MEFVSTNSLRAWCSVFTLAWIGRVSREYCLDTWGDAFSELLKESDIEV